jgi:bifunctional non-homologous end joining protein LigD
MNSMLKPPLQPMLLTELEQPFNSDEYIFEIKWDGYRALVFINEDNLYLQSRNAKDLTPYFPELQNIRHQLKSNQAILDGEICYLNKNGRPVFERLQGRLWKKYHENEVIKYPAILIVWDILSLNNKDVFKLPLMERKRYLTKNVECSEYLCLSPFIVKDGKKLYKYAKEKKLEGIVAKKKDSPYEFKRSKYWYKIKVWQFDKAIIAGYSPDQMSLVVGKKGKDGLQYMGKIKLALNQEENEALFRFLPTQITTGCPFHQDPGVRNIFWVKPSVECRVRYTEITRNNNFRHGYAIKLMI